MLMRNFTRREKVMLVILVLVLLVGLYFLCVHRPVEARLEELELEKEDLELQTTVATVKLGQRNKMKAELDEIFALPKDQITVMPPYNNLEGLMVQFDSIFMGLEPKLSFPEVRFEEGIATRPIEFEFDAPGYDQARAILTRLTRTGQRALLDGLSIRPMDTVVTDRSGMLQNRAVGGDIKTEPVSVKGTIYFYELAPESLKQQQEEEAKAKAEAEAKAAAEAAKK